jgi:hypothetical protein
MVEMEGFLIIAAIAAFYFLVMFLLSLGFSTFRLHRTWIYPVRLELHEPDVEKLEPEQLLFAHDSIERFREAGFELITGALCSKAESDLYALLFVNRQSGDIGSLSIYQYARLPTERKVIIASEFANGEAIVTAWSASIRSFPPYPQDNFLSISSLKSIAELSELHQRRIADQNKQRAARRTVAAGANEQYLHESWDREMSALTQFRYVFRDDAELAYRLTWKGALALSWKYRTPIRSIRKKLHEKRAHHELKRLGMKIH